MERCGCELMLQVLGSGGFVQRVELRALRATAEVLASLMSAAQARSGVPEQRARVAPVPRDVLGLCVG